MKKTFLARLGASTEPGLPSLHDAPSLIPVEDLFESPEEGRFKLSGLFRTTAAGKRVLEILFTLQTPRTTPSARAARRGDGYVMIDLARVRAIPFAVVAPPKKKV
jgi:hypothetical protein